MVKFLRWTELPPLRPFHFCISGSPCPLHTHMSTCHLRNTQKQPGLAQVARCTARALHLAAKKHLSCNPISSQHKRTFQEKCNLTENVPREMQLNREMGNSVLDMTLLLNHWHQLSFMFMITAFIDLPAFVDRHHFAVGVGIHCQGM